MTILREITESNRTYRIELTNAKSLKVYLVGKQELQIRGMYRFDPKLPDLKDRLIKVLDKSPYKVSDSQFIIKPRLDSIVPQSTDEPSSSVVKEHDMHLARIYLNDPTLINYSVISVEPFSKSRRNEFDHLYCQLLDIESAMKGNSAVECLRFNLEPDTNIFRARHLEVLERILSNTPSVKKLALTPATDAKTLAALTRFITSNTTIEAFKICNSQIGSYLAYALAQALKENPHLKALSLRYNAISTKGAYALAKALETNSNLKELDLAGNPIGNEGATAFGDCLKLNRGLEYLELQETKMSDLGIQDIAIGLERNTCLRELYLHQNNCCERGANALAVMLSSNTTLEKLDLSRNAINTGGLDFIACGLVVNGQSRLSQLDVERNNIDSNITRGLIAKYFGLSYLTHLIVTQNNMRADDESQFCKNVILERTKAKDFDRPRGSISFKPVHTLSMTTF